MGSVGSKAEMRHNAEAAFVHQNPVSGTVNHKVNAVTSLKNKLVNRAWDLPDANLATFLGFLMFAIIIEVFELSKNQLKHLIKRVVDYTQSFYTDTLLKHHNVSAKNR